MVDLLRGNSTVLIADESLIVVGVASEHIASTEHPRMERQLLLMMLLLLVLLLEARRNPISRLLLGRVEIV